MSEITTSNTAEYTTALLCFINCLIVGSHEIWTRHTLRSEMIGLGLLNVLDSLKSSADPGLMVQIEVFEHRRLQDDDQLDLTEEKSIFDLFSTFFHKVSNSNNLKFVELN